MYECSLKVRISQSRSQFFVTSNYKLENVPVRKGMSRPLQVTNVWTYSCNIIMYIVHVPKPNNLTRLNDA